MQNQLLAQEVPESLIFGHWEFLPGPAVKQRVRGGRKTCLGAEERFVSRWEEISVAEHQESGIT